MPFRHGNHVAQVTHDAITGNEMEDERVGALTRQFKKFLRFYDIRHQFSLEKLKKKKRFSFNFGKSAKKEKLFAKLSSEDGKRATAQ